MSSIVGRGAVAAAEQSGIDLLMIDDDADLMRLMQRASTRAGHRFVGVADAWGALDALSRQTFDLLLVDMNIPGTGGTEILGEIRAAGHSAPAIVLTGDIGSVNLDSLRSLGVVATAEKSSDFERLMRAVDEAVRGDQAA
ncbi:MAG: response regulator [Actinobacteria bacterium]|nr:MAG: response regulator [Actinomycetota bacterium]